MVNEEILSHFKSIDPTIHTLLTTFSLEEQPPVKPHAYYTSLIREIVGQQLSGKVADVIYDRFVGLFPNKKITPKQVLSIPEENIRGVGMSWSKVRFIIDLSEKILARQINLSNLEHASEETVISTLTTIHGIGPWTAEMFLMFTLGRTDIFSFGDLGLKRAIQKHYGFKKEPTVAQMKKLSLPWSPYRTYAARVLWRSLDAV